MAGIIMPGMPGFGMYDGGFVDPQAFAGVTHGGSRGSNTKGSKKRADDDDPGGTTIMLRNIPNKYTRRMLIDQLHRNGYKGEIDYLYLPTDFANRCNVGYCFINFRTPDARARFEQAHNGVAAQSCLPGFNSYKVCQVTRAKWQGRDENIRRLRSGPELMTQLAAHPEWLPLLLDENGEEEPFNMDDPVKGGKGGRQGASGAAGLQGGARGGRGGRGGRSGGRKQQGGLPGPNRYHDPMAAHMAAYGGAAMPMRPGMPYSGVFEGYEAGSGYFNSYQHLQQLYAGSMPYAASPYGAYPGHPYMGGEEIGMGWDAYAGFDPSHGKGCYGKGFQKGGMGYMMHKGMACRYDSDDEEDDEDDEGLLML